MLLQYLRLETGIRLAGVMLYEQSLLLYSVGNPFWPPFLSGTSHVFLLNYFIVKVLGGCVQSSYPHQGKEAPEHSPIVKCRHYAPELLPSL